MQGQKKFILQPLQKEWNNCAPSQALRHLCGTSLIFHWENTVVLGWAANLFKYEFGEACSPVTPTSEEKASLRQPLLG
jgi:hypothetical protein